MIYRRLSLLFDDLILAKADGRYKRLLLSLSKSKLLILDDFGIENLTAENRRDLLELIEQRLIPVPQSLLVNSMLNTGTKSLATPLLPMLSSIVSFIILTKLN